jgi:hypothetical protein
MAQIALNANEVQDFVLKIFGDKKITATTVGGKIVLTERHLDAPKKHNQNIALNKLCGMFKGTNLLSSDDFAKNKMKEIELEDRKFERE